MSHHKLRNIEINGIGSLILCDASENPCSQNRGCTCALMTLANYLIMSGRAEFQNRVEGEYVTLVDIRNIVARVISTIPFPDSTLLRRFLTILSSVSTAGLHMDPIFESPIMFSDTDEWKLFMHLGVQLLHTCVIDPSQRNLYKSCHSMSLDEMIRRVGGRDAGFEKIKNMMQKAGLSFLPQHVDEGGLAILYTDNHFSIIHKYQGAIFTLETDHNVVANLPGATWKALNMGERDMFYLTSQYNPTPRQPRFKQARKWCDAKLKENHRGLGETAETSDEQKRTSCKLKREKEGKGQAESSNESNPVPALPAGNENKGDDGVLVKT